MRHFASQHHGVAARRPLVAARWLYQTFRHGHVADAVGRFAKLDVDPVGHRYGLMDVPERTGAAKAGELQPGGAVPLGDVAGHVDPAEKEGDATQAGSLQRRQAVTGLFETDAEGAGEPVDIMPHRPRGFPESGIGHQQRAGGVIAKADR